MSKTGSHHNLFVTVLHSMRMVGFERAAGSSEAMAWWHEGRQEARVNHNTIAEFGPVGRERLDLETARITGREKRGKFDPDKRPIDDVQDKSVKFSPVHE